MSAFIISINPSFTSEYRIKIETRVSSREEEVVGVLSFFPSREPSPHLRTHCHCLNCSMMMMNLQTLASLLVMYIVSIWKKAQTNPHQLSLKVTCGPFCGWNLQNLVQVVLTLKKAWVDPHQLNLEVTCLPFCDWNHQDHFSIWLPLTSLECQWV